MNKKIYVGSLSDTTTDETLLKHFSQIGEVISARVVKKITFQKDVAYGYVVMKNNSDTEKAITELNRSTLDGMQIKVIEAHFMDQERPQSTTWRKKRRS